MLRFNEDEMKEERYSELLFNYFAGNLSNEEAQELLNWLKENKANKQVVDKMSDWWAIAHVPIFQSDREANFKAHFLELVSVKEDKRKFVNYFKLKSWRSVAAVAVLLVSISMISFLIGRNQQGDVELTFVETITPYGAVSTVKLPDGSTVKLNAGSTIKYRSDFNTIDRRVEFKGEAFFEVVADAKRPFYVCSESLNVRVEGTSFNVKSYEDEETVEVLLVSGKVNVMFEEHPEDDAMLSPSEQLIFNRANDLTSVSLVHVDNAISWVKGILYFDERPFPEIEKILERKFAVDIENRSKILQNEVFSGTFTAKYNLEKILKEIDMDSKYHWFYDDDNKLIITDKI